MGKAGQCCLQLLGPQFTPGEGQCRGAQLRQEACSPSVAPHPAL